MRRYLLHSFRTSGLDNSEEVTGDWEKLEEVRRVTRVGQRWEEFKRGEKIYCTCLERVGRWEEVKRVLLYSFRTNGLTKREEMRRVEKS